MELYQIIKIIRIVMVNKKKGSTNNEYHQVDRFSDTNSANYYYYYYSLYEFRLFVCVGGCVGKLIS